jgi:hypothetical protein
MTKITGWKMVDYDENTRIAEFKADESDNELVSYEEAKAQALKKMKDHVAPYLARIQDLEQDTFAETGALPPLKAWRCDYSHKAIVVAKTKRRAAELMEESRYGFNLSWFECEGDWWYHLAQEEAIWVEELDDKERGTGVFYKPVSGKEAKNILEPYLSAYRTMDIDDLLKRVDQTSTDTGISSEGTAYKIKFEVRNWDKGHIRVDAELDHCLNWKGRYSLCVFRELDLALVSTEER